MIACAFFLISHRKGVKPTPVSSASTVHRTQHTARCLNAVHAAQKSYTEPRRLDARLHFVGSWRLGAEPATAICPGLVCARLIETLAPGWDEGGLVDWWSYGGERPIPRPSQNPRGGRWVCQTTIGMWVVAVGGLEGVHCTAGIVAFSVLSGLLSANRSRGAAVPGFHAMHGFHHWLECECHSSGPARQSSIFFFFGNGWVARGVLAS